MITLYLEAARMQWSLLLHLPIFSLVVHPWLIFSLEKWVMFLSPGWAGSIHEIILKTGNRDMIDVLLSCLIMMSTAWPGAPVLSLSSFPLLHFVEEEEEQRWAVCLTLLYFICLECEPEIKTTDHHFPFHERISNRGEDRVKVIVKTQTK